MDLQPFLENDITRLRPLLESDFEALYEVAKDPRIWEQHPASDRYKKDVFHRLFVDSINSKGTLVVIDHAFKSMEDVIFYIGKNNIRSWKAVEKLGAERITEPEFSNFMKKNEIDWTYRINKNNWKK